MDIENTSYDENSRGSFHYIIVVKQFTGGIKTVPPAGTKAYSYPNPESRVVWTFSAPTASTTYYISSLVYCYEDYWVKIPDIKTLNKVETGYVKCSDIGFNYTSYANPDNQTPNSAIGTNKEVIFNMWYLPTANYIGVNAAIPLYYQYTYAYPGADHDNSNKCTLFSNISGLYGFQKLSDDPTTYMNTMTSKYWSNTEGLTLWLAKMARTTSKDTIMQKARNNLGIGKPFIVGAGKTGEPSHMVLVTGFKNFGSFLSDYLVLDSCEEKFSNLGKFFNSYPNYATYWRDSILGEGYVYGEF